MIGFKPNPVASEFSRAMAAMRAARQKAPAAESRDPRVNAILRAQREASGGVERGAEHRAAEQGGDPFFLHGASREPAEATRDFTEAFALAGKRRRGEVPCTVPAPPPPKRMMTALEIVNAGRRRRNEPALASLADEA